jgi:hypothetical protein
VGGVSAQDHTACLEAENAQLRALLKHVLALAERLADRVDADLGLERPETEPAEAPPRCRFALPPRRLRTVWAGEER